MTNDASMLLISLHFLLHMPRNHTSSLFVVPSHTTHLIIITWLILTLFSIHWLDSAHNLGSSGILQYGLVVVSVIVIAATRLHRLLYSGSSDTQDLAKYRKTSIVHEISAQAARAAAAAFFIISAYDNKDEISTAIAATYAFGVGITRLVPNVRWQQTALHHANAVTSLLTMIVLTATWLPCIQTRISCRLDSPSSHGLICLAAAACVSFITPRTWVPPPELFESPAYTQEFADNLRPSPEETCSWFSYYCSYDFITPLIIKGWYGSLKKDHIPQVPWYDDPDVLLPKVKASRAWGKGTMWTVIHYMKTELSLMVLWTMIYNLAELVAPFGLYHLLAYIDDPSKATIRPWTWIIIMSVGPLLRSVAFQQYVFTSTRLIVRIKSGLTQELYHLALNSMEMEVEDTALDGTKKVVNATGRLATLIASDIEALYRCRDTMMVLVSLPTGSLGAMIGLYLIVGWPAVVGIGVLIASPPIMVVLVHRMLKYQMVVRKAQDSRMSLVSEYLALIKAIKFFAWEDHALEKIQAARQPEQNALWTISIIDAIMRQVSSLTGFFSLFSMFCLLTVVVGKPLTASIAFTTITLTFSLKHNLNRIGYISKNITSAMIAADLVVSLENGNIKSIEPHIGVTRRPISSLKDLGGSSPGSPSETERASDEEGAPNTVSKKYTPADDGKDGDEVDSELSANKSSGRNLTYRYVRYYRHGVLFLFCLFFTVLALGLSTATNLWLVFWTRESEDSMGRLPYYMGIFALLSIMDSVFNMVSAISYKFSFWFTARQIHQELTQALLGVSMNWYSNVPIGRVINRFSRDISSMDSALPVVGEMYTRTAVTARRIESSSQSPVFSQFSDTLAGLPIVRAQAGMVTEFCRTLAQRLRLWSSSAEVTLNCNRWVGVRVDLVTSLVSLGAGVIALWKTGTVSASLVGFSLTSASTLSGSILYLVRYTNELEVELQSFDRLLEYTSLPPETKDDKPYPEEGEYTDDPAHVIPRNWPRAGDIEFRNATIRYTKDGQDILTDISLKFKAGERVAIVGRTGSGKSTIVASLLRFTEIVSGQILYDGVDITQVPRKKLREALTIIPQEAVLFTGTIKSNLDPTNTIPEANLQKAVDACKTLASFQSGSQHMIDSSLDDETTEAETDDRVLAEGDAEKRLSLETQVAAKGENFSHGQRQVISLIRALVRDSQLMLLDEATASMDYETDRGIQEVLRAELCGSNRTMVTIAHRLRTIIDYDTIVVMGAGRVLESGSPKELYQAEGQFYDMVQHSGEKEDLEAILG
ncbi:ATP-binding cassette transporter abc4 [Ceratocystis platani]|uniref:ATP-binding cassette transporter abc4 n=1 Tax=Ceratocystis fimbriata f. sp. platani TaxID=88771 RepID=A0A0F8D975_CERFI|nr:ATP-binding cassette transporter abc4 [Ceratocystis platani]